MMNTSPASDFGRGDLRTDVARGVGRALPWLLKERGGRRRRTMVARRGGWVQNPRP
jgi:hypothetical protein